MFLRGGDAHNERSALVSVLKLPFPRLFFLQRVGKQCAQNSSCCRARLGTIFETENGNADNLGTGVLAQALERQLQS
jgi:hypothetical protein